MVPAHSLGGPRDNWGNLRGLFGNVLPSQLQIKLDYFLDDALLGNIKWRPLIDTKNSCKYIKYQTYQK